LAERNTQQVTNMFGRIRSSLTGEPLSPDPRKSPTNTNSNNHAQDARPGFLPPFFNSPPAGNSNNGVPDRGLGAASPQQEQRSFFGGLLQASNSPKPPASPGTIRASASALLKLATPPPLSNSGDNAHPEINPNALNDGIDDIDLAQRDTLEYQINRRDAYITKLQSDLHKMQTQLAQYTKDNNTLRRQQLESTHRHGIAIKLWRRTNDGLNARVECFENETTPQAAREIANLIRDAAPPNKDSAYLMMLQDQLNKATVKLEHLGSQTEIVLHKGEEVVESLREEMNEVIRERCRMELELLDQERMLEDDMKRMVVKTERRLKRVQGEIDYLEKNAVEVLKNQEEEEENADKGEGELEKEGGTDNEESETKEDGTSDSKTEEVVATDGEEDTAKDNEDGEDGNDDESSSSSESSGESSSLDKSAKSEDITKESSAEKSSQINGGKGTTMKPEQQSPDKLRTELRKLAVERDRTLSVLQKKLREKNDEFHTLMRLKDSREKSIHIMEAEKRDREEWERSRQEVMP